MVECTGDQNSELQDMNVEKTVACWTSTDAFELQGNDGVKSSMGRQFGPPKISEKSGKPDSPVSDFNEKKMECFLTGSPNKGEYFLRVVRRRNHSK